MHERVKNFIFKSPQKSRQFAPFPFLHCHAKLLKEVLLRSYKVFLSPTSATLQRSLLGVKSQHNNCSWSSEYLLEHQNLLLKRQAYAELMCTANGDTCTHVSKRLHKGANVCLTAGVNFTKYM